MTRKPHLGLAALALTIGLVGCTTATNAPSSATSGDTTAVTATATGSGETSSQLESMLAANQASHYADDDATFTESEVVAVTLTGSSATASGDEVTVAGSTVTITAAGTYRLTGSLDGQVVVDADGADVQLVLAGASLTSSTGSPLVITAADEVTVILADGTTNSVADASTYADESDGAPSSAIDSAADLSITGSGALSVTGNHNDAINSADGLHIAGGTLTITAVDDGLRGKDYVILSDGDITVTAGGDAIKSDNDTDADRGYVLISGGTVTANSGDDGIKGYTDVGVSGGVVTIASSVEAMEAQTVVISGGELNLTASDDAINVSGDAPQGFWITGGSTVLNSGGDGLDSNAEGVISGGSVVVFGPEVDDNGAFDVQNGLVVTGGELWALGSAGMAETPTQNSTQSFVFTALNGSTSGEVSISDATGAHIATVVSDKRFAAILYSGASVQADGTYTVTVDGQNIGSVAANQYRMGMGGVPGGGRPNR